MYNLNSNKENLLVKWYNSDVILALDCHKNKIYLLTKSGKILTYERNRLVKLRDVKWPYTSNLYEKIYLFRGNIFFYCGNFFVNIFNCSITKLEYFTEFSFFQIIPLFIYHWQTIRK